MARPPSVVARSPDRVTASTEVLLALWSAGLPAKRCDLLNRQEFKVEFLESERRDGVLIVRFLNGQLVDEDLVSGVGRELLEQAGEAAAYGGKLVLSFKGVASVSSHMLGRLVILHKRCRDLGVEYRLCEMSPDVYEIFRKFFDGLS